jgi:hypothetical protein
MQDRPQPSHKEAELKDSVLSTPWATMSAVRHRGRRRTTNVVGGQQNDRKIACAGVILELLNQGSPFVGLLMKHDDGVVSGLLKQTACGFLGVVGV